MPRKSTRKGKPLQVQRVNREIIGAEEEVDGRRLQPVVHVSGVMGAWKDAGGQAEFARLRLEPRAAIVREAGGKERRLRLENPLPQALLAMLLVAAGVALLLWALARRR